jgi:membrane protein YqaA with SNARE-associated domain
MAKISMAPSKKQSKLRRWEYWAGLLGLLLTVGLAAVIVVFWNDVQKIGNYGYLGAFIISLLGGATYIAPVPMTPVIFSLGTVLKPSYAPILGPVFVGIAAGLGETLGGLTVYMTGYGGGTALATTNHLKIRAVYARVLRWIEKRGALILFLLSATLNPFFYPAGLAAGAVRFGIWKYFFICLVGKTIKGMTVAFAGYYGLNAILRAFGVQV